MICSETMLSPSRLFLVLIVSVSFLVTPTVSFSKSSILAIPRKVHDPSSNDSLAAMHVNTPDASNDDFAPCRRLVLKNGLLVGFSALGFLPQNAMGVIMSNDSPESQVFSAGQALGTQDAMARFQMGRDSLDYLVNHYDDVVKNGGGDNVRRYLGTVGVSSGLYGITKVLKELQDQADDVVAYTEAMNEFDSSLIAADTSCYSANFVEYSAAKTKPEKFFEDALLEAERMQFAMDDMAAQLKNVQVERK